METTQGFHPKVAIILNITPDHLDRHKSFEKYSAVKEKIFANQTENDFLILNQDDLNCLESRELNKIYEELKFFTKFDSEKILNLFGYKLDCETP